VLYADGLLRNKVILEAVDLDTPAWERDTTGLWMDVPRTLLQLFRMKQINPAEAIHAAQHAFLNQFSMAQDLKTECKAPEKEYKATESQRKRPARLIFYDVIDKGGGVAAKAFDNSSCHSILSAIQFYLSITFQYTNFFRRRAKLSRLANVKKDATNVSVIRMPSGKHSATPFQVSKAQPAEKITWYVPKSEHI